MGKVLKNGTALLVLLIVSSFAVLPTPTFADKNSQDKTMDFIENILPIDLSKYDDIKLASDFIDEHTHHNGTVFRTQNHLRYELTAENRELSITFTVERDIITSCHLYTVMGQVITNTRSCLKLVYYQIPTRL